MKQKIMAAGVIASGILLQSLSAGEINVKKVNGKETVQVIAPAGSAVTPSVNNPNIKVEIVKSNNQAAYPALKDDLINAGSPSLAKTTLKNFKQHARHAAVALNDGSIKTITFDLDGKWTTTFNLNTVKSPKGYDITEIITSAAWAPNRACQKYKLSVSKVSAPEKFISLGVFEVDAKRALATRIKLTGEKNPVEYNVAALRFKFMVPKSVAGNATETAYREIDVIGSASEK